MTAGVPDGTLTPMTEQSNSSRVTGTMQVKRGLAEMLKGGVIMDVVTPELKIGRAHV